MQMILGSSDVKNNIVGDPSEFLISPLILFTHFSASQVDQSVQSSYEVYVSSRFRSDDKNMGIKKYPMFIFTW